MFDDCKLPRKINVIFTKKKCKEKKTSYQIKTSSETCHDAYVCLSFSVKKIIRYVIRHKMLLELQNTFVYDDDVLKAASKKIAPKTVCRSKETDNFSFHTNTHTPTCIHTQQSAIFFFLDNFLHNKYFL